MENDTPFELKSETLDALPIINHFIERLGLERMLECHLTYNNTKNGVPPNLSIGVLLRNIILKREPLYGLKEWASKYAPSMLHLQSEQVEHLNDDRIGRALENLFDADRASLMTGVVVKAIHEYDLDLDQLHNDSTSLTLFGRYEEANGDPKRGKKTLKIVRGHSKDHRPDLKQLLWILTVTADGAVPVQYRACDGNTTDDTTHIDTWNTLRNLANRPDFMYVADSKLCVSDTLKYIHGEGGRFITVMPQTRSEDRWFREYIVEHTVSWEKVREEPLPRRNGGSPEIWRAVESPIRSAEGFKIIWYWSSQKAKHDLKKRQAFIEKGIKKLEKLETRLRNKGCRLRTKASVAKAADKILEETGTQHWIGYNIEEEVKTTYRQTKKGRPGPNTQYVALHRTWFHVEWHSIGNKIDAAARCDGIFPLITNCDDLSLKKVLDIYKYQPKLEKRHEQLKSVINIAPVLLKSITRIEAFLFVYFLALLVRSLIERQIRLGMKRAGVNALPLYHEGRDCSAPTAFRIFDTFSNLQRHHLMRQGEVVQVFEPEYTQLHSQILDLLGVPKKAYPGMVE